ncbi:MAG TPA: hypothetical protein VG939_04410 [Caulobacteraceae bacterium]|nr:hypothetical protein [Caulobacteraceae bacterium]
MSALRQTYELYLEGEHGPPSFEAVLCASRAEVIDVARRLLADRDLKAVEVRQFGEHLFTLAS